MNEPSYCIQGATYDDWKKITDLSAEKDGWAMAHEDFSVWKKAFGEEKAELIVAKASDDEVLGFIGIAKFGSDVAVIGSFYVSPAHRGKGIGNILFERVIENSKTEGRNLSLNAVFKMSKTYVRKGFENFATWSFKKHAMTGADVSSIASLAQEKNIKIVATAKIDIAEISRYDRSLAADIDRSKWLEAWINHATGWSKVALNDNDEVIGYGTARLVTRNRLVFGPLYANDKYTAAALIKAILEEDNEYNNREILCWSPSTNKNMNELLALLSSRGGTHEHQGEDIICQFTKNVLPVDVEKVFAIAGVLSFI